MKINWKVAGRWIGVEMLVILLIALIAGFVSEHWAMVIAVAVAGAMVAEKVEPRPWFGRLTDEWDCPSCTMHVASTDPGVVARFRVGHVCTGR